MLWLWHALCIVVMALLLAIARLPRLLHSYEEWPIFIDVLPLKNDTCYYVFYRYVEIPEGNPPGKKNRHGLDLPSPQFPWPSNGKTSLDRLIYTYICIIYIYITIIIFIIYIYRVLYYSIWIDLVDMWFNPLLVDI